MKIELRDLMSDNEILSHVFLGCIPHEKLIAIRDKYVGEGEQARNWKVESVKIPVEMKIGGVAVNPKRFFDSWKNQMSQMISKKAEKFASEKMGSEKMRQLQQKLNEYEDVLKSWEEEINWEVPNPLISEESPSTSIDEVDFRNKLIDEIMGFYVADGNPEIFIEKIQSLKK